jgi:protein gp37
MSSTKTAIEWTDKTWNPTTGCTKVSTGCKFCYAEVITQRFSASFPQGFQFTMHPDRLEEPKRWRKPSMIFVNSMSDLFHEQMPLEYLQQIFQVMRECPQHIFQILTKRHERLLELSKFLEWTPNIWIGVSAKSRQ